MLPGLMRSLAAPRRAASIARRWSKWMSATTGSGDAAQICREAVESVGARNGDAHDLAARVGEALDLSERGRGVARVGVRHRLDGDRARRRRSARRRP